MMTISVLRIPWVVDINSWWCFVMIISNFIVDKFIEGKHFVSRFVDECIFFCYSLIVMFIWMSYFEIPWKSHLSCLKSFHVCQVLIFLINFIKSDLNFSRTLMLIMMKISLLSNWYTYCRHLFDLQLNQRFRLSMIVTLNGFLSSYSVSLSPIKIVFRFNLEYQQNNDHKGEHQWEKCWWKMYFLFLWFSCSLNWKKMQSIRRREREKIVFVLSSYHYLVVEWNDLICCCV